jgi:hypothetical protein
MLAMMIGLTAMRLAPAVRVARVLLRDYAHDTWVLRNEVRDALAQIRQADPKWFDEFARAGEKINPRLLQAIWPLQ